MANPQVEHGHIRLANQIDEAIIVADFNLIQEKIVRLVIRLTFGWKRRTVRISQADMARKCRRRVDGHWRRSMDLLLVEGVVVEVEPAIGRRPASYALNKNFERWGRYSVPRGLLEAEFNERPENVDDLQRAIQRLRAASTEAPQTDLDFGANPGHSGPNNDDRSMSPGGQSTDENEAGRVSSGGQSNFRSMSPGGGLTVPGGRDDCPSEDSHNGPNSSSDNGIGPGKASESNRKPAAGKQGEPAAAAVGSTEYESLIVDAAVLACKRRWPDHALSTRHAGDLVVEFLALGIPSDFAADAIRTAAARKLGDPPASVVWFRFRVLDLWRDRAHEVQKHDRPDGPAPRRKMEKPAQMAGLVEDVIDPRIAERRDEYDRARRAHAVAWGKDPQNADEYRRLVEQANSAHDPDLLKVSTWIQRARDVEVMNLVIQRAPFPEFPDWLAEHHSAEHSQPIEPRR